MLIIFEVILILLDIFAIFNFIKSLKDNEFIYDIAGYYVFALTATLAVIMLFILILREV